MGALFRSRRWNLPRALLGLAAAVLAPALVRAETQPPKPDGHALYRRYCQICHGQKGNGRGPAAPLLWPQPRDFTRATMKWGTAEWDLARVIRDGVPGTSMPAFGQTLKPAEIGVLLDVVDELAGGQCRPGPGPGDIPEPSRNWEPRAKDAWTKLGCGGCHGPAGKGDGPSAPELREDRGIANPPYDLAANPPRGGGTPERAYRFLKLGLPGTAMPSYGEAAEAQELRDLAELVIAWSRNVTVPATRKNPVAVTPEAVALYAAGDARPDPGELGFAPRDTILPCSREKSLGPADRGRADLCLRCHQEAPDAPSLHGVPAVNTFREWLESPYARRGVLCQDCHHALPGVAGGKGLRDPETVRQKTSVVVTHHYEEGKIAATATLLVHDGHHFPANPAAAAILRFWFADAKGNALPAATRELRFTHDPRIDTRIPSGESRELTVEGRVPEGAVSLRAELEVRAVKAAPYKLHEVAIPLR